MYPSTETMVSHVIGTNIYGLSNNSDESRPEISHCQKLLLDVDSLYEVHDQVNSPNI